MLKNPLDVLKSGLAKLKNLTKAKKDDLLAHLHRKKISTEEEEWLDNAANPVDNDVDDDVVNKKTPMRKEALTACIHPPQWLVKALDCTTPKAAKNARLKAAHNVNLPCSESG